MVQINSLSAAATMYQHARRIAPLVASSAQFTEISELQAESLLVAMNALSLIEPKSAWISLPALPDAEKHHLKRRRLSKHISDDKYRLGTKDVEVVDLMDLRREYMLIKSRLDLTQRDPSSRELSMEAVKYFIHHYFRAFLG